MSIVQVAVTAAIALVVFHAGRWAILRLVAHLRRQPERAEECTCGALVPVSRAHIVSDVWDDPESGGGTAVSAAFCKACCPGACNRSKEHR